MAIKRLVLSFLRRSENVFSAVLKPPHTKRWRAGPASSNIANQLGLRRQSIAATALSPEANGFALNSRLTQSGVALRLPPHSMTRPVLPSVLKHHAASAARSPPLSPGARVCDPQQLRKPNAVGIA